MRSSPTPDQFRLAMGRFASGVTVLTTFTRGHDHAMTANAVTSVSMEPMLVLVCVEVEARFHDAVVESGTWGVSMLSAAQRPTADWLSTRGGPCTASSTGSRTTAAPPASRSSRTRWQRLSVRPPTSTPRETTASWWAK